MAAPSSKADDVDFFLDLVWRMIGDVPEIAEEWQELAGWERASWALDWDQVALGDVTRLDRHFRAGDMSSSQQADYLRLLGRFAQLAPVLMRLELAVPTVPLDPRVEDADEHRQRRGRTRAT